MSKTIVIRCTCASAFQDARYGPGKRVHNEKANGAARCTVCAAEKLDVFREMKK